MNKKNLLLSLIILLPVVFAPCLAIGGPLNPCTAIATANANTLIQAPSYYQALTFDVLPVFTNCFGVDGPTTATIIVANPPQNPPPTAPVYLSLTGADAASQVLLTQGTTVISKLQFAEWFPTTAVNPFTGVTIYSPATPWVPASITIIWQ